MEREYWYISVDDEIATHFVLQYVLKRYPNYHRKAFFTCPETAMFYLQTNTCDLMFLDVEMPDMDGFTLMDKLTNPPLTIMLTGYPTEYSEKAHEYYDNGIIDFISKSMEDTRFRKSLDRFEKLAESKMIMNLKQGYKDGFHSEGMVIQEVTANKTLYVSQILYVKVEKNYLHIHTIQGDTHIIRSPLHYFTEKYFPPETSLQVSRDTVVLMHNIMSYNAYSVNMGKDMNGNDILVPIATSRRREVEAILSDYIEKKKNSLTT